MTDTAPTQPPSQPTKAPAWAKWLLIFNLAIAALFAAVITYRSIENNRAESRRQQLLERLEAANIPIGLHERWRQHRPPPAPSVPYNDEDAPPRFTTERQIYEFELKQTPLTIAEQHLRNAYHYFRTIPENHQFAVPLHDDYREHHPELGTPWPEDVMQLSAQRIEQNTITFDSLDRGFTNPEAQIRFTDDFWPDETTRLAIAENSWILNRSIIRWLMVRSMVSSSQGHSDIALIDAADGIRLANILTAESNTDATLQMMQPAFLNLSTSQIEATLSLTQPSTEALQNTLNLITNTESRINPLQYSETTLSTLADYLRHPRRHLLQNLLVTDLLIDDSAWYDAKDDSAPVTLNPNGTLNNLETSGFLPIGLDDGDTFAVKIDRLIDEHLQTHLTRPSLLSNFLIEHTEPLLNLHIRLSSLPHHEIARQDESLYIDSNEEVRSAKYGVVRAAYLSLRSITNLRLAAAAIRIERHRIQTGQWPQSLNELQEIPNAPPLTDPMTGLPLTYQLTDYGVVLYSYGENKTDNGGRYITSDSSLDTDEFDDISFRLLNPQLRNNLPADYWQNRSN